MLKISVKQSKRSRYFSRQYVVKSLLIKSPYKKDEFFLIKVIIDGLCLLKAAAAMLKDPSHANEFEISQDELIEAAEMYSFQLSLESIRRNTNMEITKPTLESILDPDAQLSAKIPEEAFKILMGEA